MASALIRFTPRSLWRGGEQREALSHRRRGPEICTHQRSYLFSGECEECAATPAVRSVQGLFDSSLVNLTATEKEEGGGGLKLLPQLDRKSIDYIPGLILAGINGG